MRGDRMEIDSCQGLGKGGNAKQALNRNGLSSGERNILELATGGSFKTWSIF